MSEKNENEKPNSDSSNTNRDLVPIEIVARLTVYVSPEEIEDLNQCGAIEDAIERLSFASVAHINKYKNSDCVILPAVLPFGSYKVEV